MAAIGASAKGARTTSRVRIWGTHRSAFDMKPLGCRIVHGTSDERAAISETIHLLTMALLLSPPTTEREDRRTTCSTPERRISATTPGMFRYPPSRNTPPTFVSAAVSDSG